ncbi:leucyl aminopeptidase [Streptacidiphilus sp. N1-10]|uniref:Probable cytosol aminopeptidase n=1 Tax=Streptacidiphilus jeojiensis TaxID=3229225 RepID=A0ABV6XPP0_9ACTN
MAKVGDTVDSDVTDGDVMNLVPSWKRQVGVSAAVLPGDLVDAVAVDEVLGVPVATPVGDQTWLGLGGAGLRAAGMDGAIGSTLACPVSGGGVALLYGTGAASAADARTLRDAGAALAAAASGYGRLALIVPDPAPGPDGSSLSAESAAQALVEGVLLARYRYPVLKRPEPEPALESLVLLTTEDRLEQVASGAERGRVLARTQSLARDLATCPPSIMTAEAFADIAQRLAADCGLAVEVFDRAALRRLGCGGLLGVNAGSTDEPRMVKVRYSPAGGSGPEAGTLALVGKGIMYDSGGISLKPSDAVHATMKNDMTGAGSILAAMTALAALDCRTAVTSWLMCTDNMPSGSATKLGDVLTIRGGATVEVLNTDAEGRLVMADALVLATEEPCDAIVDIATLTGASMRALGAEIAGLFGNDQPLIDQVLAAARRTDEPCWQLPLARRYRAELDSDVADIKNMGGPNGGAIHAALFLEEFVAGRPWAHIDIAGPAQNDSPKSWRPRGCTGFGARLLTELALDFSKP